MPSDNTRYGVPMRSDAHGRKRVNVAFGQFNVDLTQLQRDNCLAIQYLHRPRSVTDFPVVTLLPPLQRCILALLSNKQPDTSKLDLDQQRFVERLIKRSGADVTVSLPLLDKELAAEDDPDNTQVLKERLEVVIAEIEAGNDGMITELSKVLKEMVRCGAIEKGEARELISKYSL